MGKDKTDTDLICPNAQNDGKKSIKDKENLIETRNSKSKPSIKVRKDLTEVLEDENTHDSNTSTNSKSNQSSPSHNSSSTSKEDRSTNLKATKEDLKKASEETNSLSTEVEAEENTNPKFRIASNNPTEFKLRIVPLEKLLERPPKPATPPPSPAPRTLKVKKENIPIERSRRLPQRKSKPVSFIELSDSDEDNLIISSSSESDKGKKTKNPVASKRKIVKQTSESNEEEDRKSASKNKTKTSKKSSDSDFDDDESNKTKKSSSNIKPLKQSSDSSESEEKETKKSSKKIPAKGSDSKEDRPKKSTSKRKPVEQSSESTESEQSAKAPKKKSTTDSEKDRQKRASSNRKTVEKSFLSSKSKEKRAQNPSKKDNSKHSDSEEDISESSEETDEAKKARKKSSDSDFEDDKLSRKTISKGNSKTKSLEIFGISSDTEENNRKKSTHKKISAKNNTNSEKPQAKKSSTKKNPLEQSSDSSQSEEDESINSSEKKLSKESDSEEDETKKVKTGKNSKALKNNSKHSDSKEGKSAKTKSKKKPTTSSSDSEEDEAKRSRVNEKLVEKTSGSEKSKSAVKKNSTDFEEEEPKTSLDTEEKEPLNPNSPKKSAKKSFVFEEDASLKTTTSKRKRFEKSSESEENDTVKARLKRKATRNTSVLEKEVPKGKGSTRNSLESCSDTELKRNPRKPGPKRKTVNQSTEEASKYSNKSESEEVESEKTLKKKANGKSLESEAKKHVLSKSRQKSKALELPPSPSSIRRCVVHVRRSNLAHFKDIGKSKSKRKMNGGSKSEKPSTSSARRRRVTSDDDSDFNYRRSGNIDERLADHDYDGHDVEDDDNESQKSSDSEIIPTRKKRVFRKEKAESNSDSDFEPKQKGKKKRRRVRRNSSGDSDDDDDDEKQKNKRKDIRKIIKSDDLNMSTKEAAKEEEERRRRIEERQKIYNQIYEKPESAEVTELVLDFDPETKKALLEVDKGLMKKLKPHQVSGVKFMWDACFETIKDAQEKVGSGCILAHCMGLGKTMQIVTLSHTLLSNSNKTNVERVLIISPLSTLNNWAREFKHWIGFTKKRNIEIYDLSKYKDKQTRIFKLNEWFEEGGVCILGYDMYRILTNEKAKGLRKKQREQLQQSLVNPGPDLVVCDEGHLLKNEKTSISKAVTRMRTLRRIVLTGTPLQNNLKEYYCMIQFIKPNLLGTYKEYLNRFVNPISNGQYTDSTDRDIRLMKHRSHILHKLLEGCIQRRDYSVLAPYLPPKHEYVVYTTLSVLQQLLYEHYMVHQRDYSISASEGKGAKLFRDYQELRRIWTHPMNMRINSDSVIRKRVMANENDSMEDFVCDDDDDEDDAVSSSDSSADSSKSFGSADGKGTASSKLIKTRNYRNNALASGEAIDSDIEEVAEPPQQDDPSEWWKRFVADKELNNINHSPKLVILMRLLQQCEAIGDKLLVFSQSLQSLDTIEHFLSLIDSKARGHDYEGDVGDFSGFWNLGTDYFRLDGSCSVEARESMCKKFNDTSNLRARLFLISTRAGGLGINLVSANRVVIFDVSWNPSHDTQSIFRVYRFGQEKPCYIYRLIAMGTMEQKVYERQVAKQATAKRVIDEQQISRHYNQSDLLELYTYELTPGTPREIPILPKDRLFAELLTEHETFLFKYHEHDSLLENEESENLSAEERKAAWSEYEAEKTRTVQTAQYMSYDRSAYGQFGNSSGSVTSNKIFGFRSDVLLQLLNMKIAKDHPEMSQNQVIQVVPTYLNELYSQMNSGDPSMYKDLLTLHATLVHPSGMYMNPLLYVNQNPSAAGYFQGGAQPANGVPGVPIVGAPMVPPGVIAGGPVAVQPAPLPAGAAAPGFDPNQVYEID